MHSTDMAFLDFSHSVFASFNGWRGSGGGGCAGGRWGSAAGGRRRRGRAAPAWRCPTPAGWKATGPNWTEGQPVQPEKPSLTRGWQGVAAHHHFSDKMRGFQKRRSKLSWTFRPFQLEAKVASPLCQWLVLDQDGRQTHPYFMHIRPLHRIFILGISKTWPCQNIPLSYTNKC